MKILQNDMMAVSESIPPAGCFSGRYPSLYSSFLFFFLSAQIFFLFFFFSLRPNKGREGFRKFPCEGFVINFDVFTPFFSPLPSVLFRPLFESFYGFVSFVYQRVFFF